jgi:hypothetical protein
MKGGGRDNGLASREGGPRNLESCETGHGIGHFGRIPVRLEKPEFLRKLDSVAGEPGASS